VEEGIGLLAMERTVVGVVGSIGLGNDWFGLGVVRREGERSAVGLRFRFRLEEVDSSSTL